MQVYVTGTNYGAYTANPVSTKWRQKFSRHMKEMGQRATSSVFFQSDEDLPESIRNNPRAMRMLRGGWNATVLVDPWEYGHWLGWDAHTVAE